MEIFVKPLKGLRVMKPESMTPLASEGEIVVKTPYWTKRLMDKEIEIVKIEIKKETKTDGGKK